MTRKGQAALIVLGVIVLLLVIGGLWLVGSYNGLVRSDTNTEQKWGNVQSAYQRRADLIPNLVATVKQYSNYEGDVLTKVTEARASVGRASSPSELQAAGDQLNSALSRLLVVIENYPQLKANEQYMALQVQLEGTENRINTERNNYNTAVKDYQNSVRIFPANIVAGLFNFDKDKWKPFTAKEGSDVAPNATDLFKQNA